MSLVVQFFLEHSVYSVRTLALRLQYRRLLLVVAFDADDCLQVFSLLLMFGYHRLQRRDFLKLWHQRTTIVCHHNQPPAVQCSSEKKIFIS